MLLLNMLLGCRATVQRVGKEMWSKSHLRIPIPCPPDQAERTTRSLALLQAVPSPRNAGGEATCRALCPQPALFHNQRFPNAAGHEWLGAAGPQRQLAAILSLLLLPVASPRESAASPCQGGQDIVSRNRTNLHLPPKKGERGRKPLRGVACASVRRVFPQDKTQRAEQWCPAAGWDAESLCPL